MSFLGVTINVVPELPHYDPTPDDVHGPTWENCPGCDKRAPSDSIKACQNCGDWFCELCRPSDHRGELMDLLSMCRKPCCFVRGAITEIVRLQEELREQRSDSQ